MLPGRGPSPDSSTHWRPKTAGRREGESQRPLKAESVTPESMQVLRYLHLVTILCRWSFPILCSPTAEEYKVQNLHKDQTRKPKKFKVLLLTEIELKKSGFILPRRIKLRPGGKGSASWGSTVERCPCKEDLLLKQGMSTGVICQVGLI